MECRFMGSNFTGCRVCDHTGGIVFRDAQITV